MPPGAGRKDSHAVRHPAGAPRPSGQRKNPGGFSAPDPGLRVGADRRSADSGGKGTADEKINVLTECGIKVAPTPSDMGATLIEVLKEQSLYEKCKTHEVVTK